ncbi:hypothetical protein Hhel01_02533 [Haloferula helveola]
MSTTNSLNVFAASKLWLPVEVLLRSVNRCAPVIGLAKVKFAGVWVDSPALNVASPSSSISGTVTSVWVRPLTSAPSPIVIVVWPGVPTALYEFGRFVVQPIWIVEFDSIVRLPVYAGVASSHATT